MIIIPIIMTEEDIEALSHLLDPMDMEWRDWLWVFGFFAAAISIAVLVCYLVGVFK